MNSCIFRKIRLRSLAVKIRNVTFLEKGCIEKFKLLNEILGTIYEVMEALYIIIHINKFPK
jgi:hypothetical protein